MRLIRFLAHASIAFAALQVHAQSSCPARLFASGWQSTVHVYDACTGEYLRDLDTRARLAGAMAVRLGPDGMIYVVAEGTGVIHKYRNDTLEYVGTFANVGLIGATGLAFDADGVAYVAGYTTSDVRKYDRSGASLGLAFPARSAGLRGPDNGMTFGPDGNLYVPGYDSNNVVAFDPRTGTVSLALAPRSANLTNTRGLLGARDAHAIFITSEGSGTVLRWDSASGAVGVLAAGLHSPRGIDYAPDGKLLVSDGDSVARIDPDSGERLGTLVASGAGGVNALVFLAVIARPASTPVDAAQVGTQFWIVGDAAFNGRVLDLQSALTATGTAFGDGLHFADLTLKRWGSVRMELVSCTEARFSWDSTGTDSARFGAGGYEVYRYFENEATQRCLAQGVDAADKSWVNGQWWGGQARAGEGWFVDRRTDGTTFFAWFTHRPSASAAVDAAQVGTQYWVVGDAVLSGRVLQVDPVLSATGTVFGDGLRFPDLTLKRWGSVRIELVSCTEARFSWDSTGATSAGFGSGGYEVYRYFENEDTARCQAHGVDDPDRSWINGQWWGREARSGEGLFLDRRSDGTVFFAWFTHRPR
jgi:streptogramin lyase